MISWNCLSSIYPSIICTNYTELLRCTQRFVVSRSWGNGVTRCPVQNLKLYRHYEINADQMKSRRTKMQSRRTKMQSWRTKMQFRRTKIQSEQTKMQSERTKIKSERTKMQPSTMSLKKEGRPLFLFYLILFKIHNLQRDSFPGTGIGFRPSLASGPVPVLIAFYPPFVSCQVSLAPNCAHWIVKMRRRSCCLPWVLDGVESVMSINHSKVLHLI